MICVSDYVLLYMLLNVSVWLHVNVCMVCACVFTQWPASDPMGQSKHSTLGLKYTLVPPHKYFNK